MTITIKAARINAGFTAKHACKLLGLSEPTLRAMENGSRKIKPVELAGMAMLYGVDVSELKLKTE